MTRASATAKRIPREQALGDALDPRQPRALHVDAGEPFVAETEDASSGYLSFVCDAVLPRAKSRG